MNDKQQEFARYLHQRREEMHAAEGRTYADPLTWRELSIRAGVHENSLLRWEKGAGMPTRIDDILSLAQVFGSEVLTYFDIPPQLAWLIRNRNNPTVRAIIDQIIAAAQRNKEEAASHQANKIDMNREGQPAL